MTPTQIPPSHTPTPQSQMQSTAFRPRPQSTPCSEILGAQNITFMVFCFFILMGILPGSLINHEAYQQVISARYQVNCSHITTSDECNNPLLYCYCSWCTYPTTSEGQGFYIQSSCVRMEIHYTHQPDECVRNPICDLRVQGFRQLMTTSFLLILSMFINSGLVAYYFFRVRGREKHYSWWWRYTYLFALVILIISCILYCYSLSYLIPTINGRVSESQ